MKNIKVTSTNLIPFFLFQVEPSMKATVCVGNIFSLSCGNDQYILHILYEQYSYSPTDKCHYDPGHCSQAEIINPVSAQKCNGYSHCSFPIPSGFILQVCGSQNATSFTVFYDCFSSKYFSLTYESSIFSFFKKNQKYQRCLSKINFLF